MAKTKVTTRSADDMEGAAEERAYKYQQHGRQSMGIPGNHLLRPDAPNVNLVRPDFNRGALVFRPLPSMTRDRSRFELFRSSERPDHFTNWVRMFRVASFVGIDVQKTWILYDPSNPETGTLDTNPYMIFFRSLQEVVSNSKAGVKPKKWFFLVPRKNESTFRSEDVKVKASSTMVFMQGLVYSKSGKCIVKDGSAPDGAKQGDHPNIISMTSGAWSSLAHKLNLVRPDYTGPTDNYAESMVFGNPLSIKGGAFFHLYNPDAYDCPEAHQKQFEMDKAVQRGPSAGYYSLITKLFKHGGVVFKPNLVDNPLFDIADIKANYVDLDDLFYFPSWEEQCRYIAECFATVPDMIETAWRRHPQFLTDEVKKILKRAVSAPGGKPPVEDDDDDDDYGEDDENDLTEDDLDSDDEPARSAGLKKPNAVPAKSKKTAPVVDDEDALDPEDEADIDDDDAEPEDEDDDSDVETESESDEDGEEDEDDDLQDPTTRKAPAAKAKPSKSPKPSEEEAEFDFDDLSPEEGIEGIDSDDDEPPVVVDDDEDEAQAAAAAKKAKAASKARAEAAKAGKPTKPKR